MSDENLSEGSQGAGTHDALAFPSEIKIKRDAVRPIVRNVRDALHLIERELPIELRRLPRWTFAHDLLQHVRRTGKKKDLKNAFRQMRQALSNEGWLQREG
jgi:Tfp pilus assembly protein PilO